MLEVGSGQDGEEDNLDWQGSRDGILDHLLLLLSVATCKRETGNGLCYSVSPHRCRCESVKVLVPHRLGVEWIMN